MAIDDPLDAAEGIIAAEQRGDSQLAHYAKDLSDIFAALPTELVDVVHTGPLWVLEPMGKLASWYLRKHEEARRRYLTEVLVQELRWVRERVGQMDAEHRRFMREEFPSLVLDVLLIAERTRAKERIARMGRILAASAKVGPAMTADEVEELLRISMDLDESDVRVLSALVDGQHALISEASGVVSPGQANKFWQRAARINETTGRSEVADQVGISDGDLLSCCAKLQAYGLLVQVERDESKLRRGTTLYAILPRAVRFVAAVAAHS